MRLELARARIAELAHLHAFISLTSEEGGGQVVAVKDLIDVRGTVTTGGGTILPAQPASNDAPVVQLLRQAGCVVVGKTNLHEWAFGVTSSNPHYGAVLNPHDPDRVAGGSSGGSAVAVAAGMCDWAVGSDTGGSIRIPAALCGVVGFKPTQGAISTEGVIPLSRSLDTLGPLAPDVATAARAAEVMSGWSGLVHSGGLQGPRLAVPRGWVTDLDGPTGEAWRTVSEGLPEIDFPDRGDLGAPGLTILLHESAEFHRSWVEAYPDRYGPDVLKLLRQGLEVSPDAYAKALQERDRLTSDVAQAMAGWDAVLLPTTACVAPLLRDRDAVREPLTRFTRPFNTTGQPAFSLPAPVPGLPVGIQIIGHRGEDDRAVWVAAALESRWSAGLAGTG